MLDSSLVIFWHDAKVGLAGRGNVGVVRVYRHPEAQHFAAMRAGIARLVDANDGPICLMLIVPRDESTLPGEFVVRNFVSLVRESWQHMEMGLAVVEPQPGVLRGLGRAIISSQIVLLGQAKFAVLTDPMEAMARFLRRGTPVRFRPLTLAEGAELLQAIDQPRAKLRREGGPLG